MLRRTLIAAGVVYLMVLIGAAIAHPPRPTFIHPDATAAAVAPSTAPALLPDPLLGFAINFHHTDDLTLYLKAIDQIAAMGFNSVEIVTPAFQEDGASEKISVRYGPGLSPTREDLVEVLIYARAKGLSTTLMPIVLFTHPRGNEWRGKISPEKWDPWWQSYQKAIDYFIDVANESQVQMFCVGSELLTTETSFEQWRTLIASIRSRYHGKLIYSTNWDHYHIPTFWSQLDYIGVSGYWDMTTLAQDAQQVDPDSMAKRWMEIRERLLAFSHAQKRPIIMTEIGYPTLPWALKSPWNYVAAGPDAKPDPQAQAAGYRAFLAAWEDLLARKKTASLQAGPSGSAAGAENDTISQTQLSPSDFSAQALPKPAGTPRREGFLGFYFYTWDVYHQGGATDTGYGVLHKPSHKVIEEFMKDKGYIPAKANHAPQ
jgi:hypothetical protein